MYDRVKGSQMDQSIIELSVTTPDADGKVTIKRFIFDDDVAEVVKKLGED